MKTTIAPVSSIQDPAVYPAPDVAAREVPSKAPAAPAPNADLRLIIEEGEVSGTFIYKTLDRRTGEVVRQLPREDVVRLKDSPNYEPGDVIDAHS
ncbi:MAG: hypothetical protein Q8L66_11855 [Caulobacter sp.]|nr:hypothetical protein [Caulobacter sp.]